MLLFFAAFAAAQQDSLFFTVCKGDKCAQLDARTHEPLSTSSQVTTVACTDTAACNHGNPEECNYSCYGCPNESSCNYDAEALNEDHSVCTGVFTRISCIRGNLETPQPQAIHAFPKSQTVAFKATRFIKINSHANVGNKGVLGSVFRNYGRERCV